MDTLRTIRLYGKLGAQFGRVHRLAVESTAEAIRALCVLIPGFERELRTSGARGVAYACFLGKTNISKDDLHMRGGADIRIAPVLAGAKRGGVLQTILGAVLVVVGVAINIYSEGAGAGVGNAFIQAGVAMMVGGVLQMLSPQVPKLSTGDSADSTANYNFNGPVNTSAQGNPVPLAYGRCWTGSAVISAGIVAQDQAYIGSTNPRDVVRHVLDDFTQDYFG